jgi:hemerythrin
MRAEFDESLRVGHEMIDKQHQEFINRINRLLESIETHKEKLVAIRTLDYLSDYTEFHFGQEEAYQREIGYPAYPEHKKEHDKFRQTVKELYEMLDEQEGPTQEFVEKVTEHVVQWLYRHIQGFDKSIVAYVNMKDDSERL